MTMGEGGQGEGTDLGGVRYGLGLDLDALAGDLAKAEGLIREHAARSKEILASLPVGQAGPNAQPDGDAPTGRTRSDRTKQVQADAKEVSAAATRANARMDELLRMQHNSLRMLAMAEQQMANDLLAVPVPKVGGTEGSDTLLSEVRGAIAQKNAAIQSVLGGQQLGLARLVEYEKAAAAQITATAAASIPAPAQQVAAVATGANGTARATGGAGAAAAGARAASGRRTRGAGTIRASDLPASIRERLETAAGAGGGDDDEGEGGEGGEGAEETEAQAAAREMRRQRAIGRVRSRAVGVEERDVRALARESYRRARRTGVPYSSLATGQTYNPQNLPGYVAPQAAGPSPEAAARAIQREADQARRRADQARRQQESQDRQAVQSETNVARRQRRPYSDLRTGRTYNMPEEEGAEGGAPEAPTGGRRRGGSGPTSVLGLFDLTGPNILRAAGALFGIGFGINIAAGIAREIHALVLSTVGEEQQRQVAVRAVAATYGGPAAAGFSAAAQQFIQAPTTRGTQQEYLQGVAQMAPLQQQLGLSKEQIKDLADATGALARVQGVDYPSASKAMQEVLEGNTEAARGLGIVLTDEFGRLTSVGARFETLQRQMGPVRAEQILYRDLMASIAVEEGKASSQAGGFADKTDQLSRSWERFRDALGRGGAGPASFITDRIIAMLGGPGNASTEAVTDIKRLSGVGVSRNPMFGSPFVPPGVPNPPFYTNDVDWRTGQRTSTGIDQATVDQRLHEATQKQAQDAEDARSAKIAQAAATDRATQATQQATKAANDEALGWARLSDSLLPVIQRLQALQSLEGTYQGIATAVRGPDFPYGMTDARVAGAGAITAASQEAARQAQEAAETAAKQGADQMRQRLVDAITAATDPASLSKAQQNLADFDRRSAATMQMVRAEAAQQIVGRARTDVQDRTAEIQLRMSDRQLANQGEINEYARQRLVTENDMAGLQLDQANLQDRMTIGLRTNLDLQQGVVNAQKAALEPANRLADIQYSGNEALLQIQAEYANRLLGRGGAPGFNQAALIDRARASALESPQAQLDQARAQRAVQLAQRPVQAEALDIEGRRIAYTREQRTIEDQLIPLEAARRLEEARTAEVERRVALGNLTDQPGLIAAQQAGNRVEQARIDADRAFRRWQDVQRGIDPNRDTTAEAIGAAQGVYSRPTIPGQSMVAQDAVTRAATSANASIPSIKEVHIHVAGSTNMSPQELTLAVYAGLLRAADDHPGRAPAGVAGVTP